MKKMIVILILVSTALVVYSCNFFASRKDKSKEQPYKEYIGKILTLNDDYILCERKDFKVPKEQYYIIKDDNSAGPIKIDLLKKGTTIKLSKAIHYNTGLSGIIGSYVVGRVFADGLKKEVDFFYMWGNKENDFSNGKNQTYFTFPKAIWQEKEDTTRYFIENR